MNNLEFLNCILRSFKRFLDTGSRSNEKLKILHGEIATDLANKLGQEYTIKSLGFDDDREGRIQGRYINKNVDITVFKNGITIAGVGIKFVMQNYSQNSNNYFENMLGETANIRSNNIPYFQIFIIPEKLPYYNKDGIITNWEVFNAHNIHKYKVLSEDVVEVSLHTPAKTLLFVIKFPDVLSNVITRNEYNTFYRDLDNFEIVTTDTDFGVFASNVIFNNYEDFIQKIVYRILSI